jgi:hypothetical protein
MKIKHKSALLAFLTLATLVSCNYDYADEQPTIATQVQQTAFSTNLRQQLFKVWSSRGFLAIKR